nr:MAG TPA: hypothetical protein [Caudoviricetes sp.]
MQDINNKLAALWKLSLASLKHSLTTWPNQSVTGKH